MDDYQYTEGDTVQVWGINAGMALEAGEEVATVNLDADDHFEIVSQDWDFGPTYNLRLIGERVGSDGIMHDYVRVWGVPEKDLIAV